MPYWSRRGALQAAGGVLLTAVAGCAEDAPQISRGPRVTPVHDVTVLKVRHREPVPMVLDARDDSDESGGDDSQESASTESPRDRGGVMAHLTGPPTGQDARIRFPEDTDGTPRVREFLEATAFDTASVYLLQSAILECYDRHLTGVYREGDGADADFCGQLRPADVDCATDAYDMLLFAIRLPFPGDEFNSVGGGSGSECRAPHDQIMEPDTALTVGDTGGSSE